MRFRAVVLPGLTLAVMLVVAGCSSSSSPAKQPENPIGANLTLVSADPYTVGPGQHAPAVAPHMLANGSTLVAAFQTGRIVDGGATDIGWATSTDGGTTWKHGFLPGLTKGEGTGQYDAASDPAVAYDASHGVWMIASLPIAGTQTPAVTVSRSTDGGLTWQNPVSVDATSASSDKNWIACDSWAASPHYGNCYVEWDDPSVGDEILMSTSTDGGLTWGAPLGPADAAVGIGGQPLVQPSGTVVVPIETFTGSESTSIAGFSSTDGGASWSAPGDDCSECASARGRGRVTQRAAAFGCSGRRGNCVGGVGRLPLSRVLLHQRPGLQHFDGWGELERGDAHPDRRYEQHGGSLYSGDRD